MNMKVGYIEIPVFDMKEAVNFYEKLFGTKKLLESEKLVIFDCNGVEIALVCDGKKNVVKGIYFVVDDVDQAYSELKNRSVEFLGEPVNASWGGRIVCFKDPDGNEFCIYKMLEK
ncbi:MAG: VOC family protein [candidate division WOR-3 bacterium]|nr:MAG: VOC family protein [candidate division WOR-3 bacterium]